MLHVSGNEESMSLVLDVDTEGNMQQDFVRILDPPKYIELGTELSVEYLCHRPGRVGVEVLIGTDLQSFVTVFGDTWHCSHHSTTPLRRKLSISKLPPKVAYKPSFEQRCAVNINRVDLRAWILDEERWNAAKERKNYFQKSFVRIVHRVKYKPPHERPDKPPRSCKSFLGLIAPKKYYQGSCAVEPEIVHLLDFPVALSGGRTGVHRVMPSYKNQHLINERQKSIRSPKFTFVIWVYIEEYCPSGYLCSILHHFIWDDNYKTPLLFINRKGQLHVQIFNKASAPHAFLTNEVVPKEKWSRLMFSYHNRKWDVSIFTEGEKLQSTHYTLPDREFALFDDMDGIFVAGGSEMNPSFKGYIGDIIYYRRKNMHEYYSKLTEMPDPYHPMFQLQVTEREARCARFKSQMKYRIRQNEQLLETIIRRKSCSNKFSNVLGLTNVTKEKDNQCPLYRGRKSKYYRAVNKIIRRWVFTKKKFNMKELGQELYEKATQLVESSGLQEIKEIVPILKQASCYGVHDATCLLATILNKGIGVKAQETLGQAYLMQCATSDHRACLMALGNKHAYGLDGMPHDYELSFVYYKAVADLTREDREKHDANDVETELVRLTDEEKLKQQTDEKGDLFLWLKHQASQGVLNAQQNMAKLLFWGSQGIKRNLQAAADYYRMGAEQNDPTALHDYGIVLLKGQGTDKDVKKGVEYLERAKDMGNPMAMNALGWHAMVYDKDYDKALEYFEKSYKKGNADAAHNLGHMFSSGKVPGGIDKVKAFDFFQFGAYRGQLESATLVACYNMRGHPHNKRDPLNAVEWARYVSEQNPTIGKILWKGLKAYRDHNWQGALLWYMQAAELGVEVGNFNMAFLCEENTDGLVTVIEKECQWHHYNLSIHRQPQHVNTYSWIKMGDYYWYGCQGVRDPQKALDMYLKAAERGDPHALFNIGFLLEEGVELDPQVFKKRFRLKRDQIDSKYSMLHAVYTKCKDAKQTEAYLPCSLALYRVQLTEYWTRYHLWLKFSTFVGAIMTVALTASSIYFYFRGNHVIVDTV